MHSYFLKIPAWVRKLFPTYLWKMPVNGKKVFLTFDDGPHPIVTPWVLEELEKYTAKATFFCIGKNVMLYPEIYRQLLAEGHAVGNHTYSHLNGWKTPAKTYLEDVTKAAAVIDSSLFRPPYGRITRAQAAGISKALSKKNGKMVMWDVLSADFDGALMPNECAHIVLKHCEPGSIIVFHDSEKAFENLKGALPVVLDTLKREGYTFEKLEEKA